MNTIENYVDTMFMNLAVTDEILALKSEILANMEDKYEELKSEGLTENEAIGMVISEFGNIDELLSELDVKKKAKSYQRRDLPALSIDDIDSYIAMKKDVSIGIGLGVILCGITASAILIGVHFNSPIIGVAIGIFISVFAVSLFIINGIRHSKYDYLEKGFFLEQRDKEYIEFENKSYEKSFNVSLIIGISLCIISAIPVIIGSQYINNILLCVSSTIVIATIGCFFLIYGGNVKGGYTFLLEKGMDVDLSEDELANQMFWKKFNENFWLVVVAGYLLISFVFNSWGYSWIIFPIAGVLSGIWQNNKE